MISTVWMISSLLDVDDTNRLPIYVLWCAIARLVIGCYAKPLSFVTLDGFEAIENALNNRRTRIKNR